jgi:hypothetical protein
MCGVLSSPIPEVELAALDCLAAMASGNETVGAAIINTNYMGKSLINQVIFRSVDLVWASICFFNE